MELLLEAGVENVGASVMANAARVASGVRELGFELMIPRDNENSASGIVSFRKADVDSRYVVKKLRDAGITAAPRQGWVRVSPHFYNDNDDLDRFLLVLRDGGF
jgi:selenocysteine lyase/cysteine desulfurase